ncbi:MAG: S8 family serine peptidase [archaeon]
MKKIILGILFVIGLLAISGIAMAESPKGNDGVRVIAPTTSSLDKVAFRMKGCIIMHELNDATALKCPADVVPTLNVREDKVFHIMDTDANAQINADDVWTLGYAGTGITVAVLDTGVDYTHPELSTSITGGKSFVTYTTGYLDDHGHGTHVAGIITADGVGGTPPGYAKGVAPDAGVWMGKVCDATGSCLTTDIAAGIEYVVQGPDGIPDTGDEPAKIISISLGGGGTTAVNCDSDYLAGVVNWAVNNGVTVAAAAGNTAGIVSSPGCASGAIAVGAVDKTDVRAYFSGTGSALDIMAPGVSIYSSLPGNTYDSWSGTSMATPHIAATVALLKQKNPALTDLEIKNALYNTAVDLGLPFQEQGHGRVDALAAVNYNAPPAVATEFYDGFEDLALTPEWSESGEGDWNIETPIEAYSGYAAHSDNCDTECTIELTNAIDLTGKTGAKLTFWRWVDNGLDSGEYLAADIWDGNKWVQIAYWTNGAGDTDVWEFESYDLNNYLVNGFSVRFRTKESSNLEHVYVDDVKIVSYGIPVEDTAPPVVILENPADETTDTDGTVTFEYTPDDADSGISGCELIINDTAEQTDTSITEGIINQFEKTGMTNGVYVWNVKCTDGSPNANEGSGTARTLIIDIDSEMPTITDATGNTTGTTGEPVTISATITDNIGVVSATVHYTPIDGTETTAPMTKDASDVWSADVPVASDKVGTITYYINAEDAAGNTAGYPETETYSITVTDNDAPVAEAGPDREVLLDQEVTFDGSDSSDNIGITGYSWDFDASDDIPVDATGIMATHTYTATGTYTVTLTVTDAAGNTDSDTLTVNVIEETDTMHITSISMNLGTRRVGRNIFYHATATVTIDDALGNKVEGATVSGHWSDATSDIDTGITGASGQVALNSNEIKNAATGTTFIFTVDSVTKDGWTYKPSENVVVSGSTTI